MRARAMRLGRVSLRCSTSLVSSISASESAGTVSYRVLRSSVSSLQSSSARTLAVRVSSEIKAISPKKSSGPMSAMVIVGPGDSSTNTSQRPDSTTNMVSPGAPWGPITEPREADAGASRRGRAGRKLCGGGQNWMYGGGGGEKGGGEGRGLVDLAAVGPVVSAGQTRGPVKGENAGSNPVGTAI